MSGKQIAAPKRRAGEVLYPERRASGRPTGRSPSPLQLFVGSLVAAAVFAGVLIAASMLGGRSDSVAPAPATVAGARETQRLLAGIPQHGSVLGRPDAPVTLVEYADLQCRYCGHWAREVLPTIVREYVRSGHVRLVFRGVAFVGPESAAAVRTVAAAGLHGKLWNVADLVYRNQGVENSGWVTDRFLRGVVARVPGLDPGTVLGQRTGAAVGRSLAVSQQAFQAAGAGGTPAFELGRTGGTLQLLRVSSLEPGFFRAALDAELGR